MFTSIEEGVEAYKKEFFEFMDWKKKEGFLDITRKQLSESDIGFYEAYEVKSRFLSGMNTALGMSPEEIKRVDTLLLEEWNVA